MDWFDWFACDLVISDKGTDLSQNVRVRAWVEEDCHCHEKTAEMKGGCSRTSDNHNDRPDIVDFWLLDENGK